MELVLDLFGELLEKPLKRYVAWLTPKSVLGRPTGKGWRYAYGICFVLVLIAMVFGAILLMTSGTGRAIGELQLFVSAALLTVHTVITYIGRKCRRR